MERRMRRSCTVAWTLDEARRSVYTQVRVQQYNVICTQSEKEKKSEKEARRDKLKLKPLATGCAASGDMKRQDPKVENFAELL